jgi:transcriptional regulator with XRE-family HTH domain
MTDERPPWAERLRAERERRKWTQVRMASKLRAASGVDYPPLNSLERQVRGWEAGDHHPGPDWRRAYSAALGLSETELFAGDTSFPAQPDSLAANLVRKSKASSRGAGREEEEDDVERRRMLQALAALGVASVSPVSEALQTIRGCVEKSLGSGGSSALDEWEETIADHGYAYLSISPALLIRDLVADLVAVQSMTPRIREGHPQHSRWCRITGGLAALTAKTLGNLGRARDARRWWATAQHAADTSGDLDMSLWVTGERLIHGIYDRRPAAVLLGQATSAAVRASGRPSVGLAKATAAQAQLLAMAGREDAAFTELRRVEEVFAHLPSSVTQDVASISCWGEDRLRYTQAWVYAHLGESDRLHDAVDQALAVYEAAGRDRAIAQVKLMRAFGVVRSGDVAE